MTTFNEALGYWVKTLNDWYNLDTDKDEVLEAFHSADFVNMNTDWDEDHRSYTEVFMKSEDGWIRYLDTADREILAEHVEVVRKKKDPNYKEQICTYGELGGNLMNLTNKKFYTEEGQ